MNAETPINAVILAGGLGRRLGGRDKGLVPLKGRALVEWVIARMAPQVGGILISSTNRAYLRFGYPLIADALPDHAGPLAGILAALEQAGDAEFVVSVSCDVPQLPTDLVARLRGAVGDAAVCAAHDGTRLHPVIALWRPALAPRLRAYLDSGERRVQRFIESVPHAHAVFHDPAAFANLNTEDDLRRLEATP